MSGTNGHADPRAGTSAGIPPSTPSSTSSPLSQRFSSEKVKQLVAELEVPFDASLIDWRVTNTAKEELRGQIAPYASPRAYTDRLNALVSPAGWTRRYAVHTSANFERAKDKKIVAKVLVTCELTIFGLGTHSATGEEFADSQNALTTAEAQSFKRAASCFGLGRYLYYFREVWVDLDERKRPKSIPRLFAWATPEGWRQGLRPVQGTGVPSANSARATEGNDLVSGESQDAAKGERDSVIAQIEAMASRLGRRLYRGVLKSAARVWNATEIHDLGSLRAVLGQMQAAERELRQLDESLNRVKPGTLASVLRSLRLNSLDQVDSLDTLKKVVLGVEREAQASQ
jgi:hypothetical protein